MLNNLYNINGVPKYVVGNLTHSDSHQKNCLFPFTNPVYAQTSIVIPASLSLGSTNLFSLTLTATNETFTGTIVTSTVALTSQVDSITSQINQIIPSGYTVSYNPNTATFIFNTNVAGISGLFSVRINNTTTNNTLSPTAITPLQPGRLVVPVTTNVNTGLGQHDSQVSYRYPVIGDSADVLAAAVFVVRDGHTNNLSIYDYFEQGRVLPGTTFAGLDRGIIIPSFNSNVSANPVNTLFVETSNAAGLGAGNLTVFASGTTLVIPNGKLRIISGTIISNSSNVLHEVQINY
jgi:hypothetical protein